ncbi:MAG: hypothetical protein ACYDHU_02915 [Acidimicrobiales bacterium]
MTTALNVLWVGGGPQIGAALASYADVPRQGQREDLTFHAVVLGDSQSLVMFPSTLPNGELWHVRDYVADAAFPQFLMGFIASRGVDVLHVYSGRMVADLLPAVCAAYPELRIVASARPLDPEEGGFATYLLQRYANLVHMYLVHTSATARALRHHRVPDSAIDLRPPDHPVRHVSDLVAFYSSVAVPGAADASLPVRSQSLEREGYPER